LVMKKVSGMTTLAFPCSIPTPCLSSPVLA
jgi:hypothetical protein